MKRITKNLKLSIHWVLKNLNTHYIVAWNDNCESNRNSYIQGMYITESYNEAENKSNFLLRYKKKDIQITTIGPFGIFNNIVIGKRVINIDDSSYFHKFKKNKVIWISNTCNCEFHIITKDCLK